MLQTLFTGQKCIHLSQADSTNSYAQESLSSLPPEGTVVYTSHQYAGRGQKGNRWESTPGKNLAASIVYYPHFLKPKEVFYLSKIVSIAVWECISAWLPEERIWIKWPNDILVDKKKICGILIENQLEELKIKSTVIGIGININQGEFPAGLEQTATSMFLHLAEEQTISEVLYSLLNALERWYLVLRSGDRQKIDHMYYQNLYGYQENMDFLLEGKQIQGQILGVDAYGRLGVQIQNQLRFFDIKEIRLLLP